MDHGPHSHVCANAEGGVCHCDCRGARHGVAHVIGGRIRHDPEVDVRISRIHKPGGGYRVVDRKTGLPPGGGTPDEKQQAGRGDKAPTETREQRLARRAAEVTVRTQDDLDGAPALSKDLKARVDRARAALPADVGGWNDPIDRNKQAAAEQRVRVQKAVDQLDKVKADRARELEHHNRVYDGMSPRLRKKYRAEFDAVWDEHEKNAQDSIDRNKKWLDEYENPTYANLQYPQSANGETTVPAEWKAHLKTVMDVGRATLAEHRAGLARDPEYKKLAAAAEEAEAIRDANKAVFFDVRPAEGVALKDYYARRTEAIQKAPEVRAAAAQARTAAAQYDQARLMAMLKSHRSFGTVHHDIEVLDADEQHGGTGIGNRYGKARSDAREMMREAESFYPDGWVEKASARSKLRVGTADRAFYSDGSDNPIGEKAFLAMPAESAVAYDTYLGGHGRGARAGALDVSVHELGHRMEKSVPGLTQLEMALVHDRSTSHDGVLEKAKPIAGYAAVENSFHDTWGDPYAGKTYFSLDPGSQHWEVFQVGMQDTFGRHTEYDKSDDLQSFVLGALLTL